MMTDSEFLRCQLAAKICPPCCSYIWRRRWRPSAHVQRHLPGSAAHHRGAGLCDTRGDELSQAECHTGSLVHDVEVCNVCPDSAAAHHVKMGASFILPILYP